MSTNQSLRRITRTRLSCTPACASRQIYNFRPKVQTTSGSPSATTLPIRRFHSSEAGERTASFASQNESEQNRPHELSLEEEMLTIQDAAIAEFENQLGKTVEQAANDGQIDLLLGPYRASRLNTSIDESIIEATESPLSVMRAGGAPSEVIAREARNIFGDYLPANELSSDELTVYKRLYGEPLPLIDDEHERWIEQAEEVDIDEVPDNALFDAEGVEVPYHLENEQEIENHMEGQTFPQQQARPGDAQATELDNTTRIEEVVQAVAGDLVDEENFNYEQEEDIPDSEDTRSHPLTSLGRFATYPRTTFLPRDTFVGPVQQVMSNFSNRQLREMCEKIFGGPGLPNSPLTPRSGRARQQVPVPLEAGQQFMGQMEANAFLTTVMPPTYASISATLVETRKRLGSSWLNKLLAQSGGPRVLDTGSGGAGIMAWKEIVRAHWESLHTSDKSPPPVPESKSVVLTGSDALRHRSSSMLENTTFVPRLPDYVNTRQIPTIDDDRPAQQRKQFDVIIASHCLFSLKEDWERKQYVQNLWSLLNDKGGVLVLIEKGVPRGFEAIAAARDMLLENYISVPQGHETYYSSDRLVENTQSPKSPGMIVAPCTNHDRCPLYRTSGVSKGRKDICSFQQRYIRPPFLQRLLGAKDRNHDDVDFSYISVMKGDDLRTRSFSTWEHISDPMSAPKADASDLPSLAEAQKSTSSQIQQGFEHIDPTWSDSPVPPAPHNLPRIINAPLKRQGHITMDLCTPQAEIRRWTIPKSFSRQAYRDARKARWGDLWALGAKTSVARNLKLGIPAKEVAKGEGMKGSIGKPRSRKERLEMQAAKILEAEEVAKSEEEQDEKELARIFEEPDLIDEHHDDGLIDMDTLLPKKATKPVQRAHANTSPPKSVSLKSVQTPTSSPKSSSPPAISHPNRRPIDMLDFYPGRYGQEDSLANWTADIERVAQEDEAKRSREGRRATAKNTRRLKRDLRRVKRESTGNVESF